MDALERMGLRQRMKLVGLLTFIGDLHEIGLEKAQGLYLADSWYWTRDAASRRWAARFFAAQQRMPSSLQAADYSATLQYLRAVAATGSTAPDRVLAHLRGHVLDDMYVRAGRLRNDGTMLHDMYLLRVKAPGESREAWDHVERVATVPGHEAFPR